MNGPIVLREGVLVEDRDAVADIVHSTGFFNAEEQAVAVALVGEYLAKGNASGYRFIFAEIPSAGQGTNNHPLFQRGSAALAAGGISQVVAYTCYGAIAGTQSSFDLYWIVVHGDHRGNGFGKRLLEATIAAIRAAGGTRLYAETSTRAQYERTRHFYSANGFQRQACLPDFYAPGDGKLIYYRPVQLIST